MLRLVAAGFAVVIVAFSPREAQAVCKIGHYIIRIGETTSANWTTDGSPCVSNFKLAKTSKFSSLRIASKPSHGFAGRSGVDSIAYRADPGFKGTDAFVISIEGHGKGKPGEGTAIVRVYVRVE
jgi:hypothetical protein